MPESSEEHDSPTHSSSPSPPTPQGEEKQAGLHGEREHLPFSFVLSFKWKEILTTPDLEERLSFLEEGLSEDRDFIPGAHLKGQTRISYFVNSGVHLNSFTAREMYTKWSRHVYADPSCLLLSPDERFKITGVALKNPETLDKSLQIHYCIREWLKSTYPMLWRTTIAPELQKTSGGRGGEEGGGVVMGGVRKTEENEMEEFGEDLFEDLQEKKQEEAFRRFYRVLSQSPQGQSPEAFRELWTFLVATPSRQEYKGFVKEYHALQNEFQRLVAENKKNKRKVKDIEELKQRMEKYNAHILGYELTTPNQKQCEQLFEEMKQQTKSKFKNTDKQNSKVLQNWKETGISSSENCQRYLDSLAEKSGKLLHAVEPFSLPQDVAIQLEKLSLNTALTHFRRSLAEFRATQPINFQGDSSSSSSSSSQSSNSSSYLQVPVQLLVAHNARLTGYKIGDKIKSLSSFPSSVLLPLFHNIHATFPPTPQGLYLGGPGGKVHKGVRKQRIKNKVESGKGISSTFQNPKSTTRKRISMVTETEAETETETDVVISSQLMQAETRMQVQSENQQMKILEGIGPFQLKQKVTRL